MSYNYRVKYEETIETLEPVCVLFDADNSEITMRFVSAVMGVLVLIFMFIYGNPGGGTPQGLIPFFVKFLAAWALLAAIAMLINRTLWRKAVRATAAGDAETMYLHRKSMNNGKNVTSQIDFYEDRFESVTKLKKQPFEYGRVTKLLESDKAFGLVVKTDTNTRAIIGFPKEALKDGDLEGLKSFLMEKCSNVKKIKKLV